MNGIFEPYLRRWELTIDGEPLASKNGNLLPVSQHGVPAIIKISQQAEEQRGSRLMAWWGGDGAAPVLAHDGEALLMVRAQGPASLIRMVKQDQDDDATRILCATAARLHRTRAMPLPTLVPLTRWFEALWSGTSWSGAAKYGRTLEHSARTARELLGSPRDTVVLHGDIHHGNVLDFGQAGWLAIDPKGLYGERGFDYANIFCNPDRESALAPGTFARRIELVTVIADMDRRRLLQWVLAWTGLSAVWMLEDGDEAGSTFEVAKLAAAALGMID